MYRFQLINRKESDYENLEKVTALVLSLAMTLSASATVLAQAPSIKEGHVTTTASVTNDGIYINGKYYTKVQFKHLLNKAQKTETVQPYDLGDAGALIAGTWWIPGIGEVIVTTAGLVIVAGVIYGVGTWVYDTVTQWFAERAEQAYEDAKILENQQINIQRKVLLKALLCLKPEPRIRLRISKIVKV